MAMVKQVHKEPLRPRHEGAPKSPRLPSAYKYMEDVPAAEKVWVQEHSLLIFTELCNAGYELRAVLAAIFLTGMHYAVEIGRESENRKG